MAVVAEILERDADAHESGGRRAGPLLGDKSLGLGVQDPVAEGLDLLRRVGGPAHALAVELTVEPNPRVLLRRGILASRP